MADAALEVTGTGSGSGSVYGSGDGYGDGYGTGSGYGYGSGSGELLAALYPQAPEGSRVGFWRSDSDGRPANGGSGDAVSVGLTQTIPGPLKICRRGFHATLTPEQWSGDRWWVVALAGEVQDEDDKMAALTRVILDEL